MCSKSFDRHTWCIIALCLFCLVILFSDLGGPALFEPDEGRNAEVAREINAQSGYGATFVIMPEQLFADIKKRIPDLLTALVVSEGAGPEGNARLVLVQTEERFDRLQQTYTRSYLEGP